MSQTVIKLENIGKQYRLGLVGSGTLRDDLRGMWYRFRGKEDPTLKIGEENRLDITHGEYVWALRDINLEVKKGEILGIIGKNGAGKSTLLKLLSRVTSPTTGQIKVRGRIASLLEVGTGFHGELTGRENIFLNGAILGMKKAEIKAKFDEIVDFAGVEKYIDTPVKRYSSGMYVRLAFAVAAHLEPDILIVDEVLAVGDAEFQKKAIGKMQDISSGGGRTVLFVSHNMASVQKLCTRGILLENGGISFEGKINEAVNKYLANNEVLNSEVSSSINLRIHPQKNIEEDIGFQSLELYVDGKQSIFVNSLCVFEMKINLIPRKRHQKIRLGFVIRDEDTDYIGLNNDILGLDLFSEEVKLHKYTVSLPDFPLFRPGTYFIDLYLGEEKEDYDIIRNAAVFYLKETDVYKTGKVPYKHVNIVALPKFKIKQL